MSSEIEHAPACKLKFQTRMVMSVFKIVVGRCRRLFWPMTGAKIRCSIVENISGFRFNDQVVTTCNETTSMF
jgi:hypothetical protein